MLLRVEGIKRACYLHHSYFVSIDIAERGLQLGVSKLISNFRQGESQIIQPCGMGMSKVVEA